MKSAAKWFVVGGSVLLIIGFLFPAISVSNSGSRSSISLLQIAGVSYWFILYLVPICALGILLLAFMPASNRATKNLFLAGQAGGLGGTLLILFGALTYGLMQKQLLRDTENLGRLLSPDLLTGELSIWPGFGFFVLLLGIGLVIFGLVYSYPITEENLDKAEMEQVATPPSTSPAKEVEVHINEAYLEGKKGSFMGKKFPLKTENFSIGRGRDNGLQLPDKKISRLHARIRYSQGAWFIQDQGSKIGTHLNGKPVQATRLSPGDTIKIGDDVFIFHLKSEQ